MKVCATEGRSRWVPREWSRSPSPPTQSQPPVQVMQPECYRPLRPEGRPRIGRSWQTAQANLTEEGHPVEIPHLVNNNDTNLSFIHSRPRPDTPRWTRQTRKIRKSADTAGQSALPESALPESKDGPSLASIYREAGYSTDSDERWPPSPPAEEGSRAGIRGRRDRNPRRRFENQMIVLTGPPRRDRKNVRSRIKKERRRRTALGTLPVLDEYTHSRPLARHKSHLLIEIESDSDDDDDEFRSYYYTFPSFISAVRRWVRTISYRLRSFFSQVQDRVLSWLAQFFGSQGTWTSDKSTPVFCCGLQKSLSNRDLGRLFSLLFSADDDAAVLGTKAISTQDVNVAIEQSSSLLYGELLRAGVEKLLNPDHLNLQNGGLFLDLGSGLGKVAIQAFCQRRADVLAVELSAGRASLQFEALNRLWKAGLDSSLMCSHGDPKRILYRSQPMDSSLPPSPFDPSPTIVGSWIDWSIRKLVLQLTKFVQALVNPIYVAVEISSRSEPPASKESDSILTLTLEYLGCEPVARQKKQMLNELREWLSEYDTKPTKKEEVPPSQTVPSISLQFGANDDDPYRRRLTVANGNLFSVPSNWLKRATAVLLATDFPTDKESAVGDLLDQLSVGTRVASYRHIARFYENRPDDWHKWDRIAAGARFLTSWCPDVGYEFYILERVAHSSDVAVVPKAIPLRGPICVAIAAEFKAMADLEQTDVKVRPKKSRNRRFCGCGNAICRKRQIFRLRQRTEGNARTNTAHLSPRSRAAWMMRPTSEFRECAPPPPSVSPYLKPVPLNPLCHLTACEPAWPAFWN